MWLHNSIVMVHRLGAGMWMYASSMRACLLGLTAVHRHKHTLCRCHCSPHLHSKVNKSTDVKTAHRPTVFIEVIKSVN